MRISLLSIGFTVLAMGSIAMGMDFLTTFQPSLPIIPAALFMGAFGLGIAAREFA